MDKSKQIKSKKDFRDKYFIKDVENITGIKAFTLRIWEQRYGILIPKRTDTNIRYYDEDDMKYMMNIAILNNNGYKISRIAEMSRDAVRKKTLEVGEVSGKYDNQIQSLSNAMLSFDEKEFNKTLSINILKLGMEETMEQIIFPFLGHIGMLWLSGSIHIAHEHFITNLIRQRLYVSIDQVNIPPVASAKKYLLFVPDGEMHDMSLLFASYILRMKGQHVIYLGNSTPLNDLNKIFSIHQPDAVFCALTSPNQTIPVQVFLNTLSRNWPDTQILLTGNQVLRKKDLRLPTNCRIIHKSEEFIQYIEGENL